MVGGGSWGGSKGNSPAQDDTTILRDNYGLTAATANNGAPTDSLANNNKPLYYKNPETGRTEAMTFGQFKGAYGEDATYGDFVRFIEEQNRYSDVELDLYRENAERYEGLSGSGVYYDKDTESGLRKDFEFGVMTTDTYNPLNQAFNTNVELAEAYDRLPESQKYGMVNSAGIELPAAPKTIAEKAAAYLDIRGVAGVESLMKNREAFRNQGSGGGAPSTVRTVTETTPQALRAANTQTVIGRTLGVGESEKLAKQLNKQARKNPQVNRGLGTANRTTTPGFNVEQGLREALLATPDSVAYQQAVRGMDLLEDMIMNRQARAL